MAASSGRRGRPWARIRKQVLTEAGGICYLCGHPGAGDVDHRISLAQWRAMGGHPEDPANLGAAHGALSRCSTCGRCCNQAKGNREHTVRPVASRAW